MATTQSIRLSCIFLLVYCTSFLTASKECEDHALYAIKPTDADHLALDATEPDQIRVQRFTGADTQLWKFQSAGRPGLYYLVNEHHRKVLDFNLGDDGFLHLGVNELKKCLQQKWNYDFKGRIVNAANDKNVDIYKANYTPGNHLIVWENNGCPCQEFLLAKMKV